MTEMLHDAGPCTLCDIHNNYRMTLTKINMITCHFSVETMEVNITKTHNKPPLSPALTVINLLYTHNRSIILYKNLQSLLFRTHEIFENIVSARLHFVNLNTV